MSTTIVRTTFALIAAMTALLGCTYPVDEPVHEDNGLIGAPGDGALEYETNPSLTNRDGSRPHDETFGDSVGSGEIVVDDVDLTVEVGEHVLITFEVVLDDIDPIQTSFTVEAQPEGSSIDFNAGVFEWTPTPADVGIHVIGLDLWDDAAERVLDAQRIVIEVVPSASLIEVGI